MRCRSHPSSPSHPPLLTHRPRQAAPTPEWEYVAPDGSTQGPYPAARIVKWLDADYFPDDLQLREVGRPAWTTLDAVKGRLRRQAAGPAGGGGGGAAPAPRSPRGGGGRGGSKQDAGNNNNNPKLTTGAKPTYGKDVARLLFTGGARLATDEPVWRYRDPAGVVQGPFPARSMLDWYARGYLAPRLPVAGCDRKVAPPHVPPPALYKPLGDLLAAAAVGTPPPALTLEDVKNAPAGGGGGGGKKGKDEAPAGAPAGAAAAAADAAAPAGKGKGKGRAGDRDAAGGRGGRGERDRDAGGRGRGRGRDTPPDRPARPHVLVTHMVKCVFARVQGLPEPEAPPPRLPRAPRERKGRKGGGGRAAGGAGGDESAASTAAVGVAGLKLDGGDKGGDTAADAGAAGASAAPAAAADAKPSADASASETSPSPPRGLLGAAAGFFGFGGKK